jgi:hypothetical protein
MHLKHTFIVAACTVALMLARTAAANPKPADIVNIHLADHDAGGDRARRVIYEVPAGKWLIITDIDPTGRPGGAQMFERVGDKDQIKWDSSGAYRSAVGLAFRPGSKVVLTDSGWASIAVTGYLAEP